MNTRLNFSSLNKQAIAIYLSAAIGALLVGFGDLLRGGDDTAQTPQVTVLRIAHILRADIAPSLGQPLVALALLMIIAMLCCWMYQPSTRKDACSVGLSVFAIISASAPYTSPQKVALNSPSWGGMIAEAHADTLQSDPAPSLRDYYLDFELKTATDTSHNREPLLLSLYDSTQQTLLQTKTILLPQIAKFTLPIGRYVLLIEAHGAKRTALYVDVTADEPQASIIYLAPSDWPLSFQRLLQPDVENIKNLSLKEAADFAARYEAQPTGN